MAESPVGARREGDLSKGQIVLFLLIGLATIAFLARDLWMPQGGAGSASNDSLNARANFDGTQFQITNLDSRDWTDVKCELNGGLVSGGYVLRFEALKAGQTATVGAMQFAKSDGTRFNPLEMKPQKFVITATAGGTLAVYVGGWQ